MLLLIALISRAVSMEFRSKMESPAWRRFWDWAFFGGSFTASLLFGVAVGNAMIGVPLDEFGNFTGSVLDQLGPYPLLVGVMTVSLFAMHGGLFLYLKTEGDFQQRLREWMWRSWGLFMVTFMLTTIATVAFIPRATENFRRFPWAIVVVVGTSSPSRTSPVASIATSRASPSSPRAASSPVSSLSSASRSTRTSSRRRETPRAP